jgi:hypothetical protein
LRGRPIPLEGVHLRRREERIAAVLRERFGSETELGIFTIYFSKAFCNYAVLRIPGVYPGSYKQQKRTETIFLSYLSHKYYTIENYFIFE